MTRPRFVTIGTPSYRGQVSARYTLGVLQLSADLGGFIPGWQLLNVNVVPEHLITARNVVLQAAMASSADVLLWLDADVALAYSDPHTLLAFLREAMEADVAIVGAKCVRRGGGHNVVGESSEPGILAYDVDAVGLGAALYNLSWWRRQLGAPHAGAPWWKPHEQADGVAYELTFFEWLNGVTEDYRACRWARERGGRVLVDPLMPTVHDGDAWAPDERQRRIVLPLTRS